MSWLYSLPLIEGEGAGAPESSTMLATLAHFEGYL